jgi:TPR repeat protein
MEKALEAYETGDYSKAHTEFLLEALQGNAEAQYMLSLIFEGGLGITRDDSEGIAWLQKAAEQGQVEALVKLGAYHRYGWEPIISQNY